MKKNYGQKLAEVTCIFCGAPIRTKFNHCNYCGVDYHMQIVENDDKIPLQFSATIDQGFVVIPDMQIQLQAHRMFVEESINHNVEVLEYHGMKIPYQSKMYDPEIKANFSFRDPTLKLNEKFTRWMFKEWKIIQQMKHDVIFINQFGYIELKDCFIKEINREYSDERMDIEMHIELMPCSVEVFQDKNKMKEHLKKVKLPEVNYENIARF